MPHQTVTDAMHKEMLEMAEVHGMSPPKIAEEMGVSVETVRRYIGSPPQQSDDKARLLTEDETRQLITDYTNGREIRHLLTSYKIGVTQLYRVLSDHNVPTKAERERMKREQAFLDAVTMYENGAKLNEIARAAKMSVSTFYRKYDEITGGRRRGNVGRRKAEADGS